MESHANTIFYFHRTLGYVRIRTDKVDNGAIMTSHSLLFVVDYYSTVINLVLHSFRHQIRYRATSQPYDVRSAYYYSELQPNQE